MSFESAVSLIVMCVVKGNASSLPGAGTQPSPSDAASRHDTTVEAEAWRRSCWSCGSATWYSYSSTYTSSLRTSGT